MKLLNRLKKMEEKMVAGSQAIEVAEKQREELKKTKKELKKEQRQQEKIEKELKNQEDAFLNARHKF